MTKTAIIVTTPTIDNGLYWVVRADDNEIHYLRGIGAPHKGKVGDKGRIVYRNVHTYGLWFWEPWTE